MPDVLMPAKYAVAALLSAAHALLTATGLDPASGTTWALAIGVVVVTVRLALLPAVAHGVRTARAGAAARPKLTALRTKYADRRDPDALAALAAEQRAVQAEHGLSPLGCLPGLLQIPVWFALVAVLSDVSAGRPVGAMDATLVASVASATLLGVRLADRLGALAAAPGQLGVVVGLAVLSAVLSWATQHWFVLPNTVLEGLPEPMVAAQRLTPALSGLGVLVAAGAVPVGLLVYWVANNAWTFGQQAAIARWWPTPGSSAHERRRARLGG